MYLQLGEGESTTGAHTAIVLERGAAHNWPQLVDRARCDLCGLLVAGLTTAQLAAGLGGGVRTLLSYCTTGATALSTAGVRGELPGQSARGHGVASPCGSLWIISIHLTWYGSEDCVMVLRLCWIC